MKNKKRPHNTFCLLCVQLPAKLINIYLLTGSSLNLIGRVGLFTRAGVRLWSTALIIITTNFVASLHISELHLDSPALQKNNPFILPTSSTPGCPVSHSTLTQSPTRAETYGLKMHTVSHIERQSWQQSSSLQLCPSELQQTLTEGSVSSNSSCSASTLFSSQCFLLLALCDVTDKCYP